MGPPLDRELVLDDPRWGRPGGAAAPRPPPGGAAAQVAGVEHALFDLGGVLHRGLAERWLEALCAGEP